MTDDVMGRGTEKGRAAHLVIVSGFLSISLVQKTILLRLRVVVLRRVSVFLELLSYRFMFTVGRVVGGKSGSSSGRGSSNSRRRSSGNVRSSSGVGTGGVTSVLGRVVREDLLDL